MDVVVKRVKEERAKLGLTQQQLAFDTGLSVAGIQSIETGRAKPNIETLIKLADRFGCTTDYLLGRTESENLVIIETWDDFHEYMEFAAGLMEIKDEERASKMRKSLGKYPKGKDAIPPEKESFVRNILRSTIDSI